MTSSKHKTKRIKQLLYILSCVSISEEEDEDEDEKRFLSLSLSLSLYVGGVWNSLLLGFSYFNQTLTDHYYVLFIEHIVSVDYVFGQLTRSRNERKSM